MSTEHLTPEELKIRKKAAKHQKMLVKARVKRNTNRAVKKMVDAEEQKQAELLAGNPPPVEVTHFFGPKQTTLPDSIRPTGVVPFAVPEDISPDAFIEELAKQADFRATMGENIEDPRIARFLKLIGEPENRSITWCAKSCGLSNSDLARVWQGTKSRQAFFRIVNRLPSLSDKIMDDAHGKRQSCRRCEGFGRIDVPESMQEFFDGQPTMVCPNCEGAGTVVSTGSSEHVKAVWERMGFTKKAGGVNLNINMSDHSVDATMTDMEGIEGEILEATDV